VSEPVDASLVRIRVSVIGLDRAGANLLGYPPAAGLGLLCHRSERDERTYGFQLDTLRPLRRGATGSGIAHD